LDDLYEVSPLSLEGIDLWQWTRLGTEGDAALELEPSEESLVRALRKMAKAPLLSLKPDFLRVMKPSVDDPPRLESFVIEACKNFEGVRNPSFRML
jgi:hypothetical protein